MIHVIFVYTILFPPDNAVPNYSLSFILVIWTEWACKESQGWLGRYKLNDVNYYTLYEKTKSPEGL